MKSGIDEPPHFINIVLGAHRGFQNAMPYSPELASNVQLTERIVRLLREMGAEQASAIEAREIMGLPLKYAPAQPRFAVGAGAV